MKYASTVLIALALTMPHTVSSTNVPRAISYQGRLTTTSGTPVNGPTTVTFRIYSLPAGGSILWNSGPQSVTVSNGDLTLNLGEPPMPVLDQSIFTDSARWLGVTVASDPEMTPRTKMTTVPFAFIAQQSATAPGIAHEFGDFSAGSFNIVPGTTHPLDSVMITPPADGFIVVEAHVDYGLNSVSGNYSSAWFSLSNTTTWDWDNVARTERAVGDPSTFIYLNSSLTKVESVTGNTPYKYYLIGNALGNAGAYFKLYRCHLTAMYFPTNYGTVVSTLAPPTPTSEINRESTPTPSERKIYPAAKSTDPK